MKVASIATALLALALAGTAQAAGDVNGFIVKLRDAPAHALVAQEQAQSREGRSARGEAHAARLARVLRESALDRAAIDVPSAPHIAPNGRDAQLVHFDRLLERTQAERLAQRLRARGDVEWVVPNTRERRLQSTAATPSDPLFRSAREEQWWLFPVAGTNSAPLEQRLRGVPGFQTAWATRGNGIGFSRAPVAVLDTGITPHPDLPSSRLLPGYDFVAIASDAGDGDGRDADPTDLGDVCGNDPSSWHGTKIAGLLAAQTNNGTGVAALHWDGVVLPVRVSGRCGAFLSDIVDAMRWSAGLSVPGVPVNPNPSRILNISFGGANPCDPAYQQAVDAVRQVGAVVVAAAGNEFGTPTRPANCSNVIGVGALNRDGFKSNYSNFGPQLVLSTVGGDDADSGAAWSPYLADTGLLTLSNTGTSTPGQPSYTSVYGTSFSAPLVSGTISLMLGRNPQLTPDQIVEGLTRTARRHVTSGYIRECSATNPGRCICTTSTCGAGILDADQALAYAAAPTTYVRPVSLDVDVSVDSPTVISITRSVSAQDRTANPAPGPTPTPGGDSRCGSDGICGGAFEPGWLLGLLAAAWALRRPRPVLRALSARPGPRRGSP